MRQIASASLILLSSLIVSPVLKADESDLPTVNVPRVEEPITVDGELSEPGWKKAARVTLSDPWKQTGHVLDPTEVLILSTEKGVYFAFLANDDEILAARTMRDDRTHRDDCVEVFLAKNRESPGDALGMEINAIGTVADFYYRHAGWFNHGWEPTLLKVAIKKEKSFPLGEKAKGPGFVTEIGLDWSELLYALPEKQVPAKLRANFARWNYGSNGRIFSIWSDPHLSKPGPYRLDDFGYLIFEQPEGAASPSPSPAKP